MLARDPPRFVKNFMARAQDPAGAVRAYVEAVKSGDFPETKHGFN